MPRTLLTLAALAAVLVLPLTAANAAEDTDLGDKVKSFFAGIGDDAADAADEAEDTAKDTFAFFKDKADDAEDDIDLGFKAPWKK
ncbi:hypothetical protein IZ6_08830 [Terrihabitans soli]|uniref:YtxH domain-containing protein n=1 Tax=Terrihabitans soli TaxID=708113 RepID=A0A6S6QUI7_9HYPH|nr:hypothetical protein [Terrihabitans soli]BCJ90148.1 hypothetical protein IZ6_08830 [Terrihabitans soli]